MYSPMEPGSFGVWLHAWQPAEEPGKIGQPERHLVIDKSSGTAPLPVIGRCTRGVEATIVAKAQDILHGKDRKVGG